MKSGGIGLVGSTDLREVRGLVEAILRKLDSQRPITVKPVRLIGFDRGAAGKIEWAGEPIGYLGRIDKSVLGKLSLKQSPVAAELLLEPLLKHAVHVPQLRPLPKFPAVRRDLSLIVPNETRYQALGELIDSLKLEDLETVEFVTAYRGKPLEAGQKSLTVALEFRSPTTTLTAEAVDEQVKTLVTAAGEKLSAVQRG